MPHLPVLGVATLRWYLRNRQRGGRNTLHNQTDQTHEAEGGRVLQRAQSAKGRRPEASAKRKVRVRGLCREKAKASGRCQGASTYSRQLKVSPASSGGNCVPSGIADTAATQSRYALYG